MCTQHLHNFVASPALSFWWFWCNHFADIGGDSHWFTIQISAAFAKHQNGLRDTHCVQNTWIYRSCCLRVTQVVFLIFKNQNNLNDLKWFKCHLKIHQVSEFSQPISSNVWPEQTACLSYGSIRLCIQLPCRLGFLSDLILSYPSYPYPVPTAHVHVRRHTCT